MSKNKLGRRFKTSALEAAGAKLETTVKINVYAANEQIVSNVQKARAKKWNAKRKPAVSFAVAALENRNALVAMDAIGISKSFTERKGKRIQDAAVARKQIAEFFNGETVPPLVFVDWISPKLPIEIEMIAAAPENRRAGESISYFTPPGFQPSNVYSKVARVNYGSLVYISGLYGTTPGNAAQQVLEIFESLKRAVQETGSNFESLAKAIYYVSDAEAGSKLNELRPKFYNPHRPPAASKALTHSVGFPGMSITMDMITVIEN